MENQQIAEQWSIGRIQVARWQGHYAQRWLAGIERHLPRGAPPKKASGLAAGLLELLRPVQRIEPENGWAGEMELHHQFIILNE